MKIRKRSLIASIANMIIPNHEMKFQPNDYRNPNSEHTRCHMPWTHYNHMFRAHSHAHTIKLVSSVCASVCVHIRQNFVLHTVIHLLASSARNTHTCAGIHAHAHYVCVLKMGARLSTNVVYSSPRSVVLRRSIDNAKFTPSARRNRYRCMVR